MRKWRPTEQRATARSPWIFITILHIVQSRRSWVNILIGQRSGVVRKNADVVVEVAGPRIESFFPCSRGGPLRTVPSACPRTCSDSEAVASSSSDQHEKQHTKSRGRTILGLITPATADEHRFTTHRLASQLTIPSRFYSRIDEHQRFGSIALCTTASISGCPTHRRHTDQHAAA